MCLCVCVLSIAEVFLSSLIFPRKMAIATDPDSGPSVDQVPSICRSPVMCSMMHVLCGGGGGVDRHRFKSWCSEQLSNFSVYPPNMCEEPLLTLQKCDAWE